MEVQRNEKGQVAKGARLNPDGRRGKRRLLTPSDFRQAIIAIAQSRATLRVNDRPDEEMTLYERLEINYAAGLAATRLGSKDFLELVRNALAREQREPRIPTALAGIPPEAWEAWEKLQKRKSRRPHSSSVPVARDASGRYRGCGNLRGRPRKKPAPDTLELDRIALDTANRPPPPKAKPEQPDPPPGFTMFEAQVLSLGYSKGGARVATRRSIEATMAAAARLQYASDTALRKEVIAAFHASKGWTGIR